MLFWIKMPNFIQVGPSLASLWRYIDFQDGGRYGAILLPVSDWATSVFSEWQSLSANQISSEYLNPRLRYNYFRFGKIIVHHIGILLPVSISITVIGMSFSPRLQNFVQIGPSTAEKWRRIDFKDGSRQPRWVCFGVIADHPRTVFSHVWRHSSSWTKNHCPWAETWRPIYSA